MNILVIPTTDWIRHPVPNRLNFIFDKLAERHNVFVLHFDLKKFRRNNPRNTKCRLITAGSIRVEEPSLYYILNLPFYLLIMKKAVINYKIDVILSANILPSFVANFLGVPVVFDYLDHLEESAAIYYPNSLISKVVQSIVRLFTRYNLKHAKHVITVTEDFNEYLKRMGIQDISVIPNGVDTGVLYPIDKEKAKRMLKLDGKLVLGYVGSLEYWVDLETVLMALKELQEAVLLVVGSGLFTDYAMTITKLAEEMNVRDRIIFTGAAPYERLGQYISAMDICLNPLKKMKKNEYTVGGKIFNYLSCGRPVLSSRMVSLERLLGDSIYYYDDTASFVAQVMNILSSIKSEEFYRNIALKFDWGLLAEKYEKILTGVI